MISQSTQEQITTQLTRNIEHLSSTQTTSPLSFNGTLSPSSNNTTTQITLQQIQATLNHLTKPKLDTVSSSISSSQEDQLDVALTSQLASGITFSKSRKQLVFDDEGSLVESVTLEGSCTDLDFLVSLVVKDCSFVSLKVRLQLEVVSCVADFVKSVTQTNSVALFFSSFSRFAQVVHKRKLFYEELKKKYNELIHIPDMIGSYVFIHPPTSQDTQLVFVWDIKIDIFGEIQQRLQLYPVFSRRFTLRENTRLFNIPIRFEQMVASHGLPTAFDAFVQLITKSTITKTISLENEDSQT